MKTPVCLFWIISFTIFSSSPLFSADKSQYDITLPGGPGSGPFLKSFPTALGGWMVKGSVAEASVLRGGYFTLGTTGGLSATHLDRNCTVLFGHPYAKTSYPVLHIDGSWGKPEKFFVVDTVNASTGEDSLILVYREARVDLRFGIRLENEGAGLLLTLTATNRDSASHDVGLGIVLDPAIGPRGDGVLAIDQVPVLRDTMLTVTPFDKQQQWDVLERLTSVPGMKLSLGFPAGNPSSCVIANWDDVVENDSPAFSPSPTRRLYDAVLKLFWSPSPLAPLASETRSVRISLLTPDFGSQVFMRWDLPSFIGIDGGTVFPRALQSLVTLTNVSPSSRPTGEVRPAFPPETPSSSSAVTVSLGGGSTQYAPVPLSVREIYENKVVDLVLTYTEGGQAIDSLVRAIRIPATPVSDTGLVVAIDSLITGGFPQVSLIFEAEKQSAHQKLFSLAPENVFLYENGSRIQNVVLGKDTTGGASDADIVFVLDVTGSMGGEIDAVKSNIVEFTDSLSGQGIGYRLGMVTFLDAVETVFDFTSDPAVFKGYVSAQYAHAGGDYPENSLDALYRASELPFRSSAKRVFIWITDATYHVNDGANTTRTVAEVVNRLLSLDITVNGIGPLEIQTDWFNPIIDATGGEFFNIYGNFRDVLLDIGHLEGSSRFMLTYQSAPPPPTTRVLTVEIHAGGLGGSASATYDAPGGGKVSSHGLQCYPNPFNPRITFRLELPARSRAVITIFNILGQEVRQITLGPTSGTAEAVWNGKDHAGVDVASGVYIARCVLVSGAEKILATDLVKVVHLK